MLHCFRFRWWNRTSISGLFFSWAKILLCSAWFSEESLVWNELVYDTATWIQQWTLFPGTIWFSKDTCLKLIFSSFYSCPGRPLKPSTQKFMKLPLQASFSGRGSASIAVKLLTPNSFVHTQQIVEDAKREWRTQKWERWEHCAIVKGHMLCQEKNVPDFKLVSLPIRMVDWGWLPAAVVRGVSRTNESALM